MDEGDRSDPGIGGATGAMFAQAAFHHGQKNAQHRALQGRVALKKVAQPFGHREHPLPHRQRLFAVQPRHNSVIPECCWTQVANTSQIAFSHQEYRSEMSAPDASRSIELLAAPSQHSNFSVGCYRADESPCHRSALKARRRRPSALQSSRITRAQAMVTCGRTVAVVSPTSSCTAGLP